MVVIGGCQQEPHRSRININYISCCYHLLYFHYCSKMVYFPFPDWYPLLPDPYNMSFAQPRGLITSVPKANMLFLSYLSYFSFNEVKPFELMRRSCLSQIPRYKISITIFNLAPYLSLLALWIFLTYKTGNK